MLLLAAAAARARGPSLSRTGADLKRCYSAQLAVRLVRSGVAMGHIAQEGSFRNISTSPCTLRGYPGLQLLDGTGHRLRTEVMRGTAYTVPLVRVRTVVLAPRGGASFDLGYDDQTGYELAKCPTSTRVAITPPNASKSITLAWRIQPYGGSVTHLRCGRITVSPVFA